MNQHILVDNQEAVMELVRVLHRERIAVLRIEGGHIGEVEQFAFRIPHDRDGNARHLLRNQRHWHLFMVTICDLKHDVPSPWVRPYRNFADFSRG